ncbi:lipoprotein insertase outer membrane protein LolB [Arenimonas fontis]|uniref:Outer-membrane lipoprotein LolB n=1 Tax=Arenimonas fontis TaxID=2608255 RepID=A0A5B2Z8F9_9GAMM|nr:lipoprotein insertase outer membrane protein LolB [Arenimonas fontis]KAA2284155.1 outer membrane lipoprotein LolB [Arenimonas fontis]
MSRIWAGFLLGLVLAGCASRPARGPEADEAAWLAAQAAREALLAESGDWSFSGRLAVSVAGEGGSGRLDWRQQGDQAEVRLSAPVTRTSWRLLVWPGLARLEGIEGGPQEGPDAERLLHEALGWPIPVGAMADWVRGMRAPGPARIGFGPDGLPAWIEQQGWRIEYRDWDGGEPARPRRVFAERGEARVRLVVDRWGGP